MPLHTVTIYSYVDLVSAANSASLHSPIFSWQL